MHRMFGNSSRHVGGWLRFCFALCVVFLLPRSAHGVSSRASCCEHHGAAELFGAVLVPGGTRVNSKARVRESTVSKPNRMEWIAILTTPAAWNGLEWNGMAVVPSFNKAGQHLIPNSNRTFSFSKWLEIQAHHTSILDQELLVWGLAATVD